MLCGSTIPKGPRGTNKIVTEDIKEFKLHRRPLGMSDAQWRNLVKAEKIAAGQQKSHRAKKAAKNPTDLNDKKIKIQKYFLSCGKKYRS